MQHFAKVSGVNLEGPMLLSYLARRELFKR